MKNIYRLNFRWFYVLLTICLLLGASANSILAAQPTVAWNASTDSRVVGYKLYSGQASHNYTTSVNAGNVTQSPVSGIANGKTYYFAVTAYDKNNIESSPSAELKCFTLTPTAAANGTISPSSTVLVSSGISQTFKITPSTGYAISSVLVDGVSVGAISSYTFSNVTASHQIVANFAKPKTTQKSSSTATANNGIQKSSSSGGTTNSSTSSQSEQGSGSQQSETVLYNLLAGGILPGSGGWIDVLTPQGQAVESPVSIDWPEYNNLNGEIRIARGDLDGSGTDKIIVGLGPVTNASGVPGGYFEILDSNYTHLAWGQVQWPEYNTINGETRPACGDLNGDGKSEIIIGLGPGGQGRMEVFTYENNEIKHLKWLNTGWQDYNAANGETRPASGDLNGNGRDVVVAGLGPVAGNQSVPGGSYLIFDGNSAGSINGNENQFDAFGVIDWTDYNLINGESWPAVNKKGEIVLGLGKHGNGQFEVLGYDMNQNRSQYFTWQQSIGTTTDVHPASVPVDANGADEIVLGFGPGEMGLLQLFGNTDQGYQPIGQVQTQFKSTNGTGGGLWPVFVKQNG